MTPDRTQKAIDCLVNVNMGDMKQPDWMTRVKEDYFKAGDTFFKSPELPELLDDMDADLAAAERVLPMLPRGSRRAVTAAHGLFARLSTKLRATPARELMSARVRVPDPEKIMIALGASFGPQAWKR